MGRHSTGAKTINDCLIINITDLKKKGAFQKGKVFKGECIWGNNDISFKSNYNLLELDYSVNGEQMQYKINIITRPSNLGKGEILYFLCPITNQKCRKLYLVYGSHYFKCMKAYKNRIYYPIQKCSKLEYANKRYFQLKRELQEKRQKKNIRLKYKGKKTKYAHSLFILECKRNYYDCLRWSSKYMSKSILKMCPSFNKN